MDPGQSGHPFHRGNFKLRYTPEEEVYLKTYVSSWIRTKGLLSSVVGGGFSYLLMKTGAVGPKYASVKIATGIFTGFSLARFYAMGVLHQELKDKYPDGYAAQMFYLRDHHDAFQDFMAYAREQQRRGNQFSPSPGDRFPNMPARPQPPTPIISQPEDSSPARTYQDSPQAPAGLDDRFRPQMDGLLQGRQSLPEDEDRSGKKPIGSYAMWRQQKTGPPSGTPDPLARPGPSDLPSYSPDPPRYSSLPDVGPPPPSQTDSYRSPSSYDSPPQRPARTDPPARTKPVKRNKYGDVIEDE